MGHLEVVSTFVRLPEAAGAGPFDLSVGSGLGRREESSLGEQRSVGWSLYIASVRSVEDFYDLNICV